MSTVLDDPRVSARLGGGYNVRRGDSTVKVVPTGTRTWAVCHGQNLELVPVAGGGFASGFRSAEAAVEAALA